MSGHNKWSTIKNKKAKTDAAKGKIFTKIGREIVIAVKTGGSARSESEQQAQGCRGQGKGCQHAQRQHHALH